MRAIVLALFAGTLLVAASSVASDLDVAAVQWQQQEIDLSMAPIKSHAELVRHLRTVNDSPMTRLTPRARQQFIASLVFTRKGLASYSWEPLTSLSVTDKWRLLSLFGLQSHARDVPGAAPANEIEQHMHDVAPMVENWHNKVCVIQAPDSWCDYRYGTGCSKACD